MDILPDPSSSIFTTSNLTSLSLHHLYDEPQYTRSQLSQILRRHSNLQELVLDGSVLPSVEGPGALVPIALPRLINLRLYGMVTAIAGFMKLIAMSPLHNVTLHLKSIRFMTTLALLDVLEQILTAYYECQGLEYPRKVDDLTVSMRSVMVINASSSPAAPCHPTYNFRIQTVEAINTLAAEIVLLFPLEHTHTFAATELDLVEHRWRVVLQNMKGLSHLQLDSLDIGPVMGALGLDDRGARSGLLKSHQIPHKPTVEPYPPTAPKLQSLSLSNLDILLRLNEQLFNVLYQRFNNYIGLKSLVIRACRVPTAEYGGDLESLVEEITLEGVVDI